MYPSKSKLLCALLLVLTLCFSALPQDRAQQGGKQSRPAARRSKTAAKDERPKLPCQAGDFIKRIDPNATGSFSIPLCIAPHSPVMIEFPANDPFYAHHPGDEDFLTIDKRSKLTDPLVIRPGDGFYVEPDRVRPSAVISVQMTSGLVGSFPIYAVEDVSLNNSHVIVSYDRDEVIAARRRLNLRADLVAPEILAALTAQSGATVEPVQTSTPQPTPQPGPRFVPRSSALPAGPQPTVQAAPVQPQQMRSLPPDAISGVPRTLVPQQLVTSANFTPTSSLPPANDEPPPVFSLPSKPKVENKVAASTNQPTVSTALNNTTSTDAPDLEAVTREEMSRVSNGKQALRFGTSLHGLSLAVSRSRFVVAGYRIEVIAVRNTLTEPIRLVPGQPEIYVETMNDGRPINAPRLTPRFTCSTLPEGGMLAPGSTYFFAFAFDEPILGVNDFLRVAVSQTNAADEPVSANLITAAR